MSYLRYICREIGYHSTSILNKDSPRHMLFSDAPSLCNAKICWLIFISHDFYNLFGDGLYEWLAAH